MFFEIYKSLCDSIAKSPTAVALEIGIGRGTVSAWKSEGRTPSGATLQKVADYFSVSTDYLLGKAKLPTEDTPNVSEADIVFCERYIRLSEDEKEDIRDFLELMENRKKRRMKDS